MRLLPLAAATVGCAPAPSTSTWVAPLDGQTAVGLDVDLLVFVPSLNAPPEVDLPSDLVRVVDLEAGGRVPGAVTFRDGLLRFHPRGGWSEDTRYAWSLPPVLGPVRGPELELPEHLQVEATFSTGTEVRLLAAALDGSGAREPRPCLIFSRRLTPEEVDGVALTVDDLPVEVTARQQLGEERFHRRPRRRGDPGLDVVCLDGLAVAGGSTDTGTAPPALAVGPGRKLRVWLGDQGPWLSSVADESVEAHLVALRRERP